MEDTWLETTIPVWDCRRCSALLPRTDEQATMLCPRCEKPTQMFKARLYRADLTPKTFYNTGSGSSGT